MTSHLAELFEYIGFDDADRARLQALHPVLQPHFPAVAGRFYDAVFANRSAASVLAGPEQIERLRVSLIDWMSTGLTGPWDERFYEKRSRIGRRHVAIGLQHHYMFTAMNVVRSAYSDLIARDCSEDGLAIMRSVNKLLDVELEIMVRHYRLGSEDRLVAHERRLQTERMTAMQTMTAGIAHEVRNPLNAAKLQLELLDRRIRRSGIDPKVLEPCKLAQIEIGRLTNLLNEFLAFARPPDLHLEDHDIVDILQQVIALERGTAQQHGALLELVAPPQLVATVDGPKLRQLMLNLIRNALEAVPRGGHVAVELAAAETELELIVQDDGPGIPDTVRDRIYEPFFSTKESGTGLGMSIVHSLVSQHGGTIDLETSPRGTRFTVHIPRRA